MSRRDIQLDAMLRHLGAAYYDSLHGRAAPADVTRAVDSVAEHVGEPVPGTAAAPAGGHHPAGGRRQHHGRWHSRVRDVMTTSVIAVDRITPYKEITRMLAEHRVSGLPVLMMGRHVAGMVTESDLIAARERQGPARPSRLPWPHHQPQHWGLTAGDLMTSPAVTIHPDATIAAAARLMNARHVRQLPVVDRDGKIIGIVSRRDLLSVFLRPDPDIARQTEEILTEMLPDNRGSITVTVRNGVVTITGQPEPDGDRDLVPVALRMVWEIDGVVDVVDLVGTVPAGAAR